MVVGRNKQECQSTKQSLIMTLESIIKEGDEESQGDTKEDGK